MRNVVMIAVVLAVSVAPVQAKFTLGEPEGPNLNFTGQLKVGPDLVLEADSTEPFVSFGNSAVSLFLTGKIHPKVGYMFHHSFAGGAYKLLECYAAWQALDVLSITAGQSKAPFGRVYNSSAARLLFRDRNPLAAEFAPKYQVGVTPVVRLAGGKLGLNAGVYNGNGMNFANLDPGLMYAASLEIAPLGGLTSDESAHRGYESPVFALIPGAYTVPVQDSTLDTLGQATYRDVTTTAYGGHAALRWDYLAFDAAYYLKEVDDPSTDGVAKSSGLTFQAGYAALGQFEPVARLTLIDPDIESEIDAKQTIIETGVNVYFDGYASRLGLNWFTKGMESASGEERDSGIILYYELQF